MTSIRIKILSSLSLPPTLNINSYFDSPRFDRQIEELAAHFMRTQSEIKSATYEMYLPYILWVRKSDVWSTHKELVGKIWPLLSDPQRIELTKMMAEKGKLEFKWRMMTWQPHYVLDDGEVPPET